MPWDSILESLMLVCFAVAWPASLHKAWTSRTRKGKSLFFLAIIFVGYIMGIVRIMLKDEISFVIVPYTLNTTLVFAELVLYYRNYRIDEKKPPIIPQQSIDSFRDYFQNYRWRSRM